MKPKPRDSFAEKLEGVVNSIQNRVVVVGGGIGGLAAALALALKKIPSVVLEKSGSFGEIGAGIQLGPNVFRMFERLGITDQINQSAVFVEDLIMMDSLSGEQITRVPLIGAFREKFGQPYAVTHRADFHRVLMAACKDTGLVDLQTGQAVSEYKQGSNGAEVILENGETVRGAAVIGADGLWSKIRGQMLNDGTPRVSGHIAYRAVLPMREVPDEMRWNAATLWAGPKTHLVHYPLRRSELFNLVAVFHSDRYEEGWDAAGDTEELQEKFTGIDPRPRSLLEKIETWRMWVLCDREPVKDWADGRVALLGDAAHPMLQYFAQGANMALEDAVILADLVEELDRDYSAAFEAYANRRYLRTGRVQLMARFLGDVYHASGVTRELRNLQLGQRTPEQSHNGLAWLYGGP